MSLVYVFLCIHKLYYILLTLFHIMQAYRFIVILFARIARSAGCLNSIGFPAYFCLNFSNSAWLAFEASNFPSVIPCQLDSSTSMLVYIYIYSYMCRMFRSFGTWSFCILMKFSCSFSCSSHMAMF